MKIQVLVTTMNQKDHNLLKKMNINTDAIIGNQCDYNSIENFMYNGNNVIYLNFKEKGVGLNRNNCLMRATGDICLFADDDMIYVNDYSKLVENAFLENPTADVIIFNLAEKEKKRYIIKKKEKINYLNYLRYGTARIAIKLNSIKNNAIYFNQCFGGGTEHCHGEDNLFLTACLKNGLKIIAVPITIANLTEERESTWNNNDIVKYLKDQGVLYKTISKKFHLLLCLQDSIRRKNYYNMPFWKSFKIMTKSEYK